MKQYEAVIETLEHLGGAATLGQLNQEVMKITDCTWNTRTPFASIRRIVQERPEIYKIKPGLWALESHRKQLEANGIVVETDKNADSEEVREFNHAYYQGTLLHLGNIRKYTTYIPPQDKNKKFINTPLAELDTLHSKMPKFSYERLVHRSSTIDVIWFSSFGLDKELLMPAEFYEVEHSTDIQNSLVKFSDLRAFNVNMHIVADSKRRSEYETKLSYSVFENLRNDGRISFLSYDRLVKLYEKEIELYNQKTKQL